MLIPTICAGADRLPCGDGTIDNFQVSIINWDKTSDNFSGLIHPHKILL